MRKQGRFLGAQGNVKLGNRGNIKFNLPLIIFEEDEVNIVYCPALDLSGYGHSEHEALNHFREVVADYFDYTTKKKTLATDLRRLGWHVKNSLRKKMTPPDPVEILNRNKDFKRLIETQPFRKINQEINIPAFA